MQVRTDDVLFRVDRIWLGPKIMRFPWRVSYTGYLIGLVVMVISGFIGWKLEAPINMVTFVMWFAACILITRVIVRGLNPDRPVTAAVTRFWQDVSAPRPGTAKVTESTQHLIVRRWRFDAPPETRRHVRWSIIVRDGSIRTGRRAADGMTRAGGIVGVAGRLLARVLASAARSFSNTPGAVVRAARRRRPVAPVRAIIAGIRRRQARRPPKQEQRRSLLAPARAVTARIRRRPTAADDTAAEDTDDVADVQPSLSVSGDFHHVEARHEEEDRRPAGDTGPAGDAQEEGEGGKVPARESA